MVRTADIETDSPKLPDPLLLFLTPLLDTSQGLLLLLLQMTAGSTVSETQINLTCLSPDTLQCLPWELGSMG